MRVINCGAAWVITTGWCFHDPHLALYYTRLPLVNQAAVPAGSIVWPDFWPATPEKCVCCVTQERLCVCMYDGLFPFPALTILHRLTGQPTGRDPLPHWPRPRRRTPVPCKQRRTHGPSDVAANPRP